MVANPTMEKRSLKASKPAMEKRRRARINESLQQLKALVLDGVNKNNSRHSKLEKADILEMTVRYLRSVQREQVRACVNADAREATQYRSGFTECMGEVSRCGIMDASPDVRARLIGHLAGLCTATQPEQRAQVPAGYGAVARGQMQQQQRPMPVAPRAPRPSSPAVPASAAMTSTATSESATTRPAAQMLPFPASSAAYLTSPPYEGAGSTAGTATAYPPPIRLQALNAKDSSEASRPVDAPTSVEKRPLILAPSLPTATAVAVPKPAPPPPPPPPKPAASDMITLILPSHSLPGGHVPTHLIPVYAQDSAVVVPPPHGTSPRCEDDSGRAAPTSSIPAPVASPTRPPAAWTAVQRLPTAELVSPQAGAVAPQFALATVPYTTSALPAPGLVVQQAAKHVVGPPAPLPPPLPHPDVALHSDDPMWRPW